MDGTSIFSHSQPTDILALCRNITELRLSGGSGEAPQYRKIDVPCLASLSKIYAFQLDSVSEWNELFNTLRKTPLLSLLILDDCDATQIEEESPGQSLVQRPHELVVEWHGVMDPVPSLLKCLCVSMERFHRITSTQVEQHLA